MKTSDQQFDAFQKAYTAWQDRTLTLPFRRNRDLTKGVFELDLDHLIDYVQPVLAAAAKHSTQFDYSKVAAEYLTDLDRISAELEIAPLAESSEKKIYSDYIAESRQVLDNLAVLPVPQEGHLGFRGSALKGFRFLTDEYGFEVTEATPISVGFTSAAMFVKLSYSPECPMNSVLVGKRTEEAADSGFILDDFTYAAGRGILFDYDRFDFNDSEGVAKFLQTAAALLRRYGGALLAGDEQAFDAFHGKADERERVYVEMMEREHSTQR